MLILSTHLGAPPNQCLKGLRTANLYKSFLLPWVPEEHDLINGSERLISTTVLHYFSIVQNYQKIMQNQTEP